VKNSNDDAPHTPQEDLTRREFVEKSTVITGGILLAGALSGCEQSSTGERSDIAPGVRASGDDTLKLALVGCGGRGAGAVNNAMKADAGVDLVAVADVFADRAKPCVGRLRAKFGEFRVRVNPETTFVGLDAYKQAIDLADVVVLATPGGFRPEHFEYAISQNKHVFMEKPVATDAPGIRRVLEAARVADERKLNVVVGLQRRYDPAYLETVQRYRDGAVGEIISGQVYWNTNSFMNHRSVPRESGQSELDYQLRNWYFFNWLSGDHILEQNLHNIDVANWMLDEYPEAAQGNGGRQVRTGKEYGQIFDHHFVEYVYPSGAIIHAQCRQVNGCPYRIREKFQATGGQIETMAPLLMGKSVMRLRDGRVVYENKGLLSGSPYQREHDRFFATIRGGEHINNAEYAAKSTLTAIMGRMATYSGQEIKWQDALSSDMRLVPNSSELSWDGKAPVMPDGEGRYPIPMPGSTRVL
jgi:myo-inositol 2-dehydrogenase / D-chiro-inositol 1-dehydrogenase